ncbi:MAG: hypothetical protein A3I43_03290 [Omnitrophica WOR_2 bacterium RIFCSPLOWO2_02_FULL_50_19]|nr:MAG: hypothetical protein A3I43_03290 [Omnitrophica WOR_2 bacterium RIFCSPLOWO2_02_FULL_50_19]
MKANIIAKKTLSTKEIDLLTRLEFEGKEIYTKEEIIFFCGNRQKGSYLIKKLLEKKRLRKIIKNVYLFIPMKAPGGKWAGNEYVIAKALVSGAKYYIGYSSVFNSYGFTDQVAQMIHVVNNKYSLNKNVGGIRYKLIKVLSDRIYGMETRRINREDIVFASKERALIDAFDFYGVKKGFNILTELPYPYCSSRDIARHNPRELQYGYGSSRGLCRAISRLCYSQAYGVFSGKAWSATKTA